MPLQDVWTDIEPINSRAAERLGYPTQKPEPLLERIITASSNPGDIVLDPFCGCGTTIAVAERLRRQWVGIDISPTAVQIMERRLTKETNGAVAIRTEKVPRTEGELRRFRPYEFQNWVIQQVRGTPSPRKSGDMGVDGLSYRDHEPIQVKQSDRVGREVVDRLETAVQRSGKLYGYLVAFSFTRGAYQEAARARAEGRANVLLVTVAEILETVSALTQPALSPRPQAPSATAARQREGPARRPTPALMRLLSARLEALPKQPWPEAPRRQAKPSFTELRESNRAATPVG